MENENLNQELEQVFEAAEKIYDSLQYVTQGFEKRPVQLEGIKSMCMAMMNKKTFRGEFPCGTGKSFMYAVASSAMYAVFPNERTLMVTENISLQEQLSNKDLPAVIKAFKIAFPDAKPLHFKSMKGRSNYICNKKMKSLRDKIAMHEIIPVRDRDALTQIISWSTHTSTGDMGELDIVPERDALEMLTMKQSDTAQCSICDYKKESCYYYSGRRRFVTAPLGVLNYHLFFAGLTSSKTKVIGPYTNVVFDEAHNIAKVARDYNERSISKGEVSAIKRVISHAGTLSFESAMTTVVSPDLFEANFIAMTDAIDTAMEAVKKIIGFKSYMSQLSIGDGIELKPLLSIRNTIALFEERYVDYVEDLLPFEVAAYVEMNDMGRAAVKSELEKVYGMTAAMVGLIDELVTCNKRIGNTTYVYWIEEGKHFPSIKRKPYMVGPYLNDLVYSVEGTSQICVSATLAVNRKFEYFDEENGIESSEEDNAVYTKVEDSPFDLRKQELWYLPPNALEGNHSDKIELENVNISNISQILSISGGGMLCLFTSIKSMERATEVIRKLHPNLRILKQGESQRGTLLERFSRDINSSLFATKSFFTGIDVKGPALRVLVLEKLPFEQPDDPVMKKLGSLDKGFVKYFIPDMIMAMKQAIGRGIRGHQDRCLVMILDARISTARYRKIIDKTFEIDGCFNERTRDIKRVTAFLKDYVPDPEILERMDTSDQFEKPNIASVVAMLEEDEDDMDVSSSGDRLPF